MSGWIQDYKVHFLIQFNLIILHRNLGYIVRSIRTSVYFFSIYQLDVFVCLLTCILATLYQAKDSLGKKEIYCQLISIHMKKSIFYLLLSFCLLASTKSFSQTEQGSWLVGGTFRTGIFDLDEGLSALILAPNAGYFVIDQLAITGEFNFTIIDFDEADFAAGFGGRYYVTTPEESQVLPYAFLGFRFSDFTDQFNIGVGADLFITPNVALEGNLTYSRLSFDSSGSQSLGQIGLSFGLQVFLSQGN